MGIWAQMDFLAVTEQQAAGDWFAEELASAASSPSDGQVAMVERTAPPGPMPPLVRRDEQETYRVLTGEVVFFVGDDAVWAGPGDVVVAPAGAARTFRVGAEGTRWLALPHTRS